MPASIRTSRDLKVSSAITSGSHCIAGLIVDYFSASVRWTLQQLVNYTNPSSPYYNLILQKLAPCEPHTFPLWLNHLRPNLHPVWTFNWEPSSLVLPTSSSFKESSRNLLSMYYGVNRTASWVTARSTSLTHYIKKYKGQLKREKQLKRLICHVSFSSRERNRLETD